MDHKSRLENVRSYYSNFSENYNSMYASIQESKFKLLTDLIEERIDKNSNLDIGGGTGLLSKWLGFALVTIDISYQMLRQGVNGKFLENAITASFENLPIRSNSINSCFSFTVLQNLPNPKLGLIEINRVTQSFPTYILSMLKKSITHTNFLELCSNLKQTEFMEIEFEDYICYSSRTNSDSGS